MFAHPGLALQTAAKVLCAAALGVLVTTMGCTKREEPEVATQKEPEVHCYFVAFQFQSNPEVKVDSAVGNSFICAPGEPGTRAVVESIQKRLKDVLLAAKKPTAVVILNIMPAEDK